MRQDAHNKAVMKAEQKTADAAAKNAVIAERIRTKLLNRIEKEIDALPEHIGTEMTSNIENLSYDGRKLSKKTYGGKNYKLRDLTAAYRDLMADMPREEDSSTMDRLDAMLAEVKNHATNA